LTDNSGNPLNGNYNITLRLYDVAAEGTALCSDTQTLGVDNGLFNAYLEGCAAQLNGSERYLGIEVGSDGEMTPRQPILPVPYAFSLRPGAQIRGSSSTTPTLWVVNSGGTGIVGGGDIGVQGIGTWGVYGQAAGLTGYGVYGEAPWPVDMNGAHGVYGKTSSLYGGSAGVYGWATSLGIGVKAQSGSGIGLDAYSHNGTAIYAGGTGIIRSTADIEIVVSSLGAVKPGWSAVEIEPQHSRIRVRPTNISSVIPEEVLIPVDLPSLLYGTRTRLKSARICYRCDQAVSFVDKVEIAQGVDETGTPENLLEDDTDRASTDWECYTITADTPLPITRSVYIDFSLWFAGIGASHDINIGNITLTLVE
jgi:hypothetical protein